MKYQKIEEIKNTSTFKELFKIYEQNPNQYNLFNLCDYFCEEMTQSEEWEKEVKNHFNKFVDVKDIAIGGKK